MLKEIDENIKKNNIKSLEICEEKKLNYLGIFLSKLLLSDTKDNNFRCSLRLG